MAGRRVLGLAAGLLACVVVGAVGASTLSATTLGATSLGDPVGTTSYNGATTESSTGQPTARTTNGATEQTISVQPTTGRHDSTGPSSAAAGLTSSTADRTEPRLSSTGATKQTPGSIGDVSKHASAATEPSASTRRTSNGEVTKHSEDSRQTGTTTNETTQTEDRLTTRREADELTTNSVELTTDNDYRTTDEARTTDRHSTGLAATDSSSLFTPSAALNTSQTDKGTSPSQLEIVVEESTELDGDLGTTDEPASTPEPVEVASTTPLTSSTPSTSTTDDHPAPDLADKDSRDLEDAYHNEVPDDVRRKYKLSHPFLIGTRTAAKGESSATSSSPSSGRSFVLYRNYDVDSQERERELEERAREQNHPADLEDTNVHEVNHYVPEDEHEDPEVAEKVQQQQQRSVARWYLLLLAGNSTTVRLRQKDFAKYLKLNLAARLSVEYNDLRVNRVEFKPLLMVNVTIFSRPKDNEEAPLHMLADTNATLLELSGEEYHVVRFITIPNDETLASLASGGFQADSYTGVVPRGTWHVDMGVAVYFAIAAALVSILLAVFLVGLWRYVRGMVGEVQWPWRRYKPYSLPRWSLPLQHRLCADHIVHCAPLRTRASRQHGHHVWTTGDGGGDEVPVQKILAPEPPQRLVLTSTLPHLLGGEAAPSTADTLLQTQPAPLLPPAPAPLAPAAPARPNLKLSLFGSHCDQVLQPDRPALGGALGGTAPAGRNRLQPQGRHPLDVRIGPTVLGLDNPNYMLQ